MPDLVFVLPAQANIFWAEIVEATCDELESIGVRARVTREGFPPPERGLVYVLAPPHEYFALEVIRPGNPPPPTELLRRTIFICGEQPGTSHFDENVALASQAGAIFDLNRGAIRAFARRGVGAQPFQLGYTQRWDHRSNRKERDLDLLFMGSHSPRRDRYLAEFAEALWRWHCRFVLSDNSSPNFAPSGRYLADEAKWDALTRSKVLLNIHQGIVPYFEWARVVQTMANGCVLMTEHSTDFAPLEPGEHFLSAALHNAALVAETLLEDPDERERLEYNAYDFLRRELPMRHAAEELASAAEDVDRHPVVERSSGLFPRWRRVPPVALSGPFKGDDDIASLRRAVSNALSELRDVEHAIERSARLADGTATSEIAATSHGYRARKPRVWVLTVLSHAGERVEETLDSVVLGRYHDVGFLVVDDGTTDRSHQRVQRWIEGNQAFPGAVVRHAFRRGVSGSVNTALALIDSEFVLILPGGSSLFPHALGRLVAILDWDENAAFAYGMIKRHGIGAASGLGSIYPWEPARLIGGPYIDEIALVRTAVVALSRRLHHGRAVWTAGRRMTSGAASPSRVATVPSCLRSLRAARSAQRTSAADLSPGAAYEALAERHPTLMAGVPLPDER